MKTAGTSLLSVRDLVVQYQTAGNRGQPLTAVKKASLDIAPASIFGLVGESGSGKSSLAHAIMQLVPRACGTVRFHDQDLAAVGKSGRNRARQRIQFVFQDPLASLSPRRTILQTLLEPLDHFRLGESSERELRAIAALEMVRLDAAVRHRFPQALSGGQLQRVALARALVAEPELIIADEPLSSLDVPVQASIMELVLNLRDELGVAFLFVSHDLAMVQRLADFVAVMYLGEIVESAPAEVLFQSPAHPYTQSLLKAIPVPDPGHSKPVVLQGEPPSPLTPPAGCVFHMRCPDATGPCSYEPPEVTCLTGQAASPDGEQTLIRATHQVRCHLWKK
jgi:oligopeptide/dipeptide ABC transporter ATP-binding protein